MATAHALAVPEILINIISRLGKQPRPSPWYIDFPRKTNHDPALVSCLRVDSLWFEVAKDILWADIPSIDCLLSLESSRLQLYADSVRSLMFNLSSTPGFDGLETPFSEELIQAQMKALRTCMKFPRLNSLYVAMCGTWEFFEEYLDCLPFENVVKVDIRISFDEYRVVEDMAQLQVRQQIRKSLPERSGSITGAIQDANAYKECRLYGDQFEGYDLDERDCDGSFHSSMFAIIRRFKAAQRLKELSVIGIPEHVLEDFWRAISTTPGLRSLTTSFPADSDRLWGEQRINSVFQNDLDLSHLVHLEIENLPPEWIPILLGGKRSLETVKLNIDWYGVYPDDVELEVHLHRLLRDLERNKNLRVLCLNPSDVDESTAPNRVLAIHGDSLIDLSSSCTQLIELRIGGGSAKDHGSYFTITDITNDQLLTIASKLPNLHTFHLGAYAPDVSQHVLRDLAPAWPHLRSLELVQFFDFSAIAPFPPVSKPMWPGLLHFHMMSPELVNELHVCVFRAIERNWMLALEYHFPNLRSVVVKARDDLGDGDLVGEYAMPLGPRDVVEIFDGSPDFRCARI